MAVLTSGLGAAWPALLLGLAVLQHEQDPRRAGCAAAKILQQHHQPKTSQGSRHPPASARDHRRARLQVKGLVHGGSKAHPLGEPCGCQQLAIAGELNAGQHIGAGGRAVAAGSTVQASEGYQACRDGFRPLTPVWVEVPQRRVLAPRAARSRAGLSACGQGSAGCLCLWGVQSRPSARAGVCLPSCRPCCAVLGASKLCTQSHCLCQEAVQLQGCCRQVSLERLS